MMTQIYHGEAGRFFNIDYEGSVGKLEGTCFPSNS